MGRRNQLEAAASSSIRLGHSEVINGGLFKKKLKTDQNKDDDSIKNR